MWSWEGSVVDAWWTSHMSPSGQGTAAPRCWECCLLKAPGWAPPQELLSAKGSSFTPNYTPRIIHIQGLAGWCEGTMPGPLHLRELWKAIPGPELVELIGWSFVDVASQFNFSSAQFCLFTPLQCDSWVHCPANFLHSCWMQTSHI